MIQSLQYCGCLVAVFFRLYVIGCSFWDIPSVLNSALTGLRLGERSEKHQHQLSPFRRLSVRSDYDAPASFLVSFIHELEEYHYLPYVEAAVIHLIYDQALLRAAIVEEFSSAPIRDSLCHLIGKVLHRDEVCRESALAAFKPYRSCKMGLAFSCLAEECNGLARVYEAETPEL